MAQTTIDASAGSNGVRSGVGTWATIRAEATGGSTTTFITQASSATQLGRCFLFFDLSGIPSGSTIDSATLVHPIVGNHTSAGGGNVHIIEHTATDPVDTASYNDITLNGDTSLGTETYANISDSASTNITVNATGITYLTAQIGSTAKIGLRSSFDIDNSAPGANSQYTATSTNFDLIVNYTPPLNNFFALL